MLKKFYSKRGQSLIEYASLVVFVIAVFLFFQLYIARGFSGRWKEVGDSFGNGKAYTPKATDQCGNDVFTDREDVWYEVECFKQNCFDDCFKFQDTVAYSQSACRGCIAGCPCPF